MVWRTVRARDRRRPAGFIRPCQPVLAHHIPTGTEWVHELKWDGYRLIARRENSVVYLWSAHRPELGQGLPINQCRDGATTSRERHR
jgi:ATP-dependent DNA ligase